MKGTRAPLEAAQLFWDPKKKELFIYAKSRATFTRIALAIADQVEVPAEPQWYATQNMEVAASMLLGREPPIVEWEKDFQPPPPSREEKAVLNRMNALLRDLSDAVRYRRLARPDIRIRRAPAQPSLRIPRPISLSCRRGNLRRA